MTLRSRILGILAVLIMSIIAGFALRPEEASAASAPVLLWGPTSCLSPENVAVDFRWEPMGSGSQWLDLGTNPSFADGSYTAAGPFSSFINGYRWENLRPGVAYVFRVTAL